MQVRLLTQLGRIFITRDPDTAKLILDRASRIWESVSKRAPDLWKDTTFWEIRSNLLRQKGEIYRLQGEYDSALVCYQASLTVAESLQLTWPMGAVLNSIGVIYRLRSEYAGALEYFSRSARLLEEAGDKQAQASVLNNIASIYWGQADYNRALEHYFQALRIREEVADKRGQASTLLGIGNVYESQMDYRKAIEYYQRALAISQYIGDKVGQAQVLGNMGAAYYNLGKHDSSAHFYKACLSIFREVGDQLGQANAFIGLANVYEAQGAYSQALEFYAHALRLFEQMGEKKGQAVALAGLGSVYRRLGRLREAEAFLLSAIRIDSLIGALRELMEDHIILGNLREAIGEAYRRRDEWERSTAYFRRAITALKKGMELKDTLFNEESRKQLIRKELAYEYEKKRLEERVRHEAELARQEGRVRQQRLVIGSITVLLIVTAGFLWRVNRQRQVIAAQKRIVEEQKAVVERQKELVEEQRELLAQKNQEIEQSIRYARRIQEAILPSMERWNSVLPENFVLYWPRDIVAGDFYWLGEAGGYVFVAVADCTGHGVPGAMMSVLCSGALSRAVLEEGVVETGLVLDRVREEVVARVHWGDVDLRDGMDGVLLRFCRGDWLRVQFSGANQGMWIVRPNGELIEVEGDMQPVGYAEWSKPFRSQDWVLEPGSMVYLFTDGYVDQFGGTSGKKLGRKRLREWVREVYREPCEVQRERLAAYFEAWRGGLPQVDDVTVVGLRVG